MQEKLTNIADFSKPKTKVKTARLQWKNVNRLTLISICSLLLLFLIFYLGLIVGDMACKKEKNALSSQIDNLTKLYSNRSNDLVKISPTPSKSSADYQALANETPKPKTAFDIGEWHTFEDAEVGLRFKYPPEWGVPEKTLSDFNHPDLESGWGYSVVFPNNQNVYVSGASRDFMRPIGGCTFKGFETTKFPTADQYCSENQKYNIRCDATERTLHVLTGINGASGQPCQHYNPYVRMYFIDRPGELISGIEFGGTFLSERYTALSDLLKAFDNNEETVNNLVLQRKLDTESIKNFDVLERVFQTFEDI